ncbi:MAG: TPM domain-containing protein [Bacteroidales bacterium]|nr:TPM domain-containing protein [Bacteroidales bacterium]
MQKIIISILLLLSATAISAQGNWVATELEDPYVSDSTQYVLDDLEYLSDWEKDSINMICKALDNDADLQTAIVLLDEIDDDPFTFAYELYNHWQLGKNDRGLLLLLVMEQHKWRFITGYGAEADLPDALLSRIGREIMTPYMREEAYYNGIKSGFEEVYHVLTDSIYRNEQYTAAHLADYEESQDNYTDDYDGWDILADWMIGLGILLFFIGPGISAYRSEKNSLADINAEKDVRLSNDKKFLEIRVLPNAKYNDWTVWKSKSGCLLRYIVVDLCFLFVAFLALEAEDTLWKLLIGIVIYTSAIALIWCWKANSHLKKSTPDSIASFVQTNAVAESFTVNLFCIIAPHIMCIFYSRLMQQQKKRKKNLFKCPTCGGELSKAPNVEYKPTGAKLYEVDKGIMNYEINACEKGHNVILLNAGRNYSKYKKLCGVCGTYTYREVSRTVISHATESREGREKVECMCEVCKAKCSIVEKTPKIEHSSFSGSGGSYSSGGGGSYSGGGGSRGGGRSGGGGAGGSW